MKNKDDRPVIENKLFKAVMDYIDTHRARVFAAVVLLFAVSCIIPFIAEQNSRHTPVFLSNTDTAATTYKLWEDDDDDNSVTVTGVSAVSESVRDEITTEATPFTVTFPLDINSATAEELMMVKGIGEVLADRIVEYRKLNGYYYSLEDLLNVEGIGKKKLSSFNGYICINYEELPETLPSFSVSEQTEAPAGRELPAVTTVLKKKESKESGTSVVSPQTQEDDTEDIFDFIIDDPYDTDEYTSAQTTSSYYPDFPLELNTADAEDLMYIDGIGEVTAGYIVEYARTMGFTSVDDLLNVKGIGYTKLESIRPYVYVDMSKAKPQTTMQTQYSLDYFETYETTSADVQQAVYSVNINTCSKADLMQLPGITEELADKIIGLRNQIGYFVRTEELALVLSDAQLAAIMNYVYV